MTGPMVVGRRVLVVDDDADVRLLLRTSLGRAGYEVLEASNGDEALSQLAGQDVDLVVTDLMMPGGLDGFELIERLRADLRMSRLPIIAITGGRRPAERADATIAKPFGPSEVLAVVTGLLAAV